MTIGFYCARMVAALALSFSLVATGHAAEKHQEQSNGLFDRPMSFVVVRSSAGFCEPFCPEWIYAEGQIDAGSPAAFKSVLKKVGKRALPLVITSPGGNVDAAMQLGRIIRKRGMAVEVGYTRFQHCRPTDKDCAPDGPANRYLGTAAVAGSFCWSACPLVLAGGVERYSSRWSYTGVHQVTTILQRQKIYYKERYTIVDGKRKVISRKEVRRKDVATQTTTDLPKSTRKALVGYFKQMGVGRGLLDLMLSTPPDKIRTLDTVEMLNIGLITELSTTEMVADPQSCRTEEPPANCVLLDPASSASSLTTLQAPPPSPI